jgi:hypothetical protein
MAIAPGLEKLALIQQRYPQAWNWLAQHPELLTIYSQSVDETWPAERLQAALANTPYYQGTSDKERAYDVLAASNPGETAKLNANAGKRLADYLFQMGVPAPPVTIAALGNMIARWGSTDEEIHDMVVGLAMKLPDAMRAPGAFGSTMTKVRKVADEYAIPVTDQQAAGFASQILTSQARGGRSNEDVLRDNFSKQAMSLYPQLKEELSAGRTVAEWAQPYKAIAAQELGVSADTITFNDPKWQKMLQGVQADPKSGVGVSFRPMTLAEWQTTIRTNQQYGFDKTTNGRQAASGLADGLLQLFGNRG